MKHIELFKDGFDSTVQEKIQPENWPYVGHDVVSGEIVYTIIPEPQPDNEIWYTTINDEPLNLYVANADNYTWLEGSLINNTYNDGKGVWVLDAPITYIRGIESSKAEISIVGDYGNELSPLLKSVSLPNSVKEVRIWSFVDCTGLEYIKLPNCLETIDGWAFLGCSSLKTIEIPNSVNYIGRNAFEGCYFTKENFINNSSLDAEANNYWGAIVYDYEIDGMYILDNTVVYSDRNISGNVVIPDGITSIECSAFESRQSLTSIEIPNSIVSIGASAFAWCYGLETIIYIGTRAEWNQIDKFIEENEDNNEFPWNRSVENVNIIFNPLPVDLSTTPTNHIIKFKANIDLGEDYNVTNAGTNAYILDTIYDGEYYNIVYDEPVTLISWMGIECMSCASKITEVVLPDSIQYIGDRCFQSCSSLTSIVIPDGVTSILWSAFSGCESLTSIVIPESVTNIENYAFNNCYFTKENFINKSSLDAEANDYWGATIYDYEINGIYIRDNIVVKGRSNITFVEIPNGITGIGEGAFDYRYSLTSIIIPDSVTTIGDGAFYNCTGLTSITIPESVTSIGNNAFYNCYITTENFINNSSLDAEANNYWNATIYDYKVDGMYIKDNIIFEVNRSEIPSEVVIPDGITGIGDYVFSNCYDLTSITIPNSVISIGEYAFGYNYIAKENFINNSSLDAAANNYWGARVYDYKVDGMYVIDNIIFTIDEQEIPSEVIIPDGIISIGYQAFQWCNSLTSITIPNSVKSIRERAFYGCECLTSIIYEGTQTQWNAITKGSRWKYYTTVTYVQCSDGQVAL